MYNSAYFFRRRVSRFEIRQILLAGQLWRLWRPKKVFDMGCGIGSFLAAFRTLGCKVGGCDIGYKAARPFMRAIVRRHCFAHDAAVALRVGRGYDLVLCLEMAEHLPSAGHAVMFENLRKLARGPVLFSAGVPGQPGCGHISCLPREEWIARAESAGLHWHRRETEEAVAALDSVGDPLNLRNRVLVFRRERPQP
jgi:SAM-dependent methyltransferase